jgi:hypothetical protein
LEKEMSKTYSMEDLGIDTLIGRKVLSAKINSDNDLMVLDTDQGKLYLTWEGSCCAHCYLYHITGSEYLVGATITEVTNANWSDLPRGEDDYGVTESMGTNIRTDKGWVTFESRVEHNGYYGGEIRVSDDEPMDQYGWPRYDKGYLPVLKTLKDF